MQRTILSRQAIASILVLREQNHLHLQNGNLLNYPWSSYPLYICPYKRPDLLCVERVLGYCRLSDDRSGRLQYRCRMQTYEDELAVLWNPANEHGYVKGIRAQKDKQLCRLAKVLTKE